MSAPVDVRPLDGSRGRWTARMTCAVAVLAFLGFVYSVVFAEPERFHLGALASGHKINSGLRVPRSGTYELYALVPIPRDAAASDPLQGFRATVQRGAGQPETPASFLEYADGGEARIILWRGDLKCGEIVTATVEAEPRLADKGLAPSAIWFERWVFYTSTEGLLRAAGVYGCFAAFMLAVAYLLRRARQERRRMALPEPVQAPD